MIRFLRPRSALLASVLLLALAACDSAEDRAARHLRNAEALMAEGDVGAAVLEFRNVLENAPTDREALTRLAEIQLAAGAEDAAFGLYRRLVDNHPDATEGWLALAEIAIRANRWEDAAAFADQVEARAPDDARTALIRAALDFRAAIAAQDAEAAATAAAAARRHADAAPDDLIARQILVAHAGAFLGPEAALAEVEDALAVLPDVYPLHQLKVQTLAGLGRAEAVGPALEAMARQFPERAEPQQLLIDWYLRRGDPDSVERFLRARAADPGAAFSDRLTLLYFLREIRGADAALAEIDRQIADQPVDAPRDLAILRGLRASLRFDRGEAEAAIAEFEAALADFPTGAEADNLRVALAQALAATGRDADAMAEIEAVLAGDSGHVEASKIKARRLIDAGETDAAVRVLRQAQASEPRDPELMRLMGDAHARAGDWDLAGDRYAQAVDLAGRAARESLAYADFLLRQGRPVVAETVLTEALRQAPADPALLQALIELQLRENRLDDARRGIARLRGLDGDAAQRAAERLEATALLRENRTADMQALVERMAAEGRADAGSLAALIQARIAEGDIEEAKALLARQLAAFPDDPLLTFLRAGVDLVEGETDAAEAAYRAILARDPGAAPPLRVLYGVLLQQGRDDEAQALLEDIRAVAPEALLPRLLLAERAERRGDAAAAIALYDEVYADTGDLVAANNLANLLMAREDDPEALDRAHAVTRRLRGTQVPAFQHTVGWIAYLRGDHATALDYLARSAAALPDEPVVLLHLGMAHLALDQPDQARAALERVLEIAGDGDAPQAAQARETLEAM